MTRILPTHKYHDRLVVIDANGSCLTGWVLLLAWVKAANSARDSGSELGDAAAMLSPRQYEWILSHASSSAISQELLSPGQDLRVPPRMRAWGVPLMKHTYQQDELVTIMNSDGDIFAQIKNLEAPQWEPTDSQQKSAARSE